MKNRSIPATGAIPPANRRQPQRLSSMRAATRTGMTFVGAMTTRQAESTTTKARVIKADGQAHRNRAALRKAIAAKIAQLECLMEQALAVGDPWLAEEAEFWRKELRR